MNTHEQWCKHKAGYLRELADKMEALATYDEAAARWLDDNLGSQSYEGKVIHIRVDKEVGRVLEYHQVASTPEAGTTTD